MSEFIGARRPALTVVTGAPGAGKTTLADRLSRAMRCPVVCRDNIKEGLAYAAGVAFTGSESAPVSGSGGMGGDLQLAATDIFFETVEFLLRRGVTVVAEAAFQHKVWAARLQPLLAVARTRVLLCEVDSEVASARLAARKVDDPYWSRYHPEGASGSYDRPRMDVPTLRVDTTSGYLPEFDVILEFARG